MARKVTEIYDSLIAEKNNMSALNGLQPSVDSSQILLSDLSNKSNVSDWRLWLWVVAVAIWTLENLWDVFKIELDAKINSAPFATTRWYEQEVLKFQFGHALVWIDNKYKYSILDTEAQIVKRCAVVENGSQITIKVAKLVSGVVTKLSVLEKAALEAYIYKIKAAGSQTITITDDPDLLKVGGVVYYDPLVLASDGSLLSDSSVFPVEDAINNYNSKLDFNGDFIVNKMEDEIQKAKGIINPNITLVQAKYGLQAYADVIVKYGTYAGYIKIDENFPLRTQITYIANV